MESTLLKGAKRGRLRRLPRSLLVLSGSCKGAHAGPPGHYLHFVHIELCLAGQLYLHKFSFFYMEEGEINSIKTCIFNILIFRLALLDLHRQLAPGPFALPFMGFTFQPNPPGSGSLPVDRLVGWAHS